MNKIVTKIKDIAQAPKTKKALKVTAVVGVTLLATIATAQHFGIKGLNEFLEEKDLFDEYYYTEEEI